MINPISRTVVATIPLGKRPRGIKASPDGTQLFAALSGSPIAGPGVDESKLPPADKAADGIGVVDATARKLLRVVNGGLDPEQLAVSADGARAFIANEDAAATTVLDLSSGRIVATLPTGSEPEGVTMSPDGRLVYVTSEGESRVTAIDATANRVLTHFDVGPRPRASAFSPDGAHAYVTSENGGTVSVVDTAKHKVVKTIKLTGENVRPMGVVVSPDGKRVFVSTGRGGSVIVIDTATNAATGSVKVGDWPWGIGLSPDGKVLFTANGPSNDISVVDTDTLTVLGRSKQVSGRGVSWLLLRLRRGRAPSRADGSVGDHARSTSTTTAVPYASTSVTPAATSFASYRTATSALAPRSAA